MTAEPYSQVFLDPPRQGVASIPRSLYESVATQATAEGRPIVAVVRDACQQYLARVDARRDADQVLDRLRPQLLDHLERDPWPSSRWRYIDQRRTIAT